MTRADRVHSTPPLNTSPTNPTDAARAGRAESVQAFPPRTGTGQSEPGNLANESRKPAEGLSRRTALVGFAALPLALPAAAAVPDPVFAAIERHRAAMAIWDGEVDVRSHFDDLTMTAEQRTQRDALDDAVADARDHLDKACRNLISTAPTTSAGIVTALEYLRRQMRDDGTYMPYDIEFQFVEGYEGGDGAVVFGWIDGWLKTIIEATEGSQKAVRA